MGVRIEKKLHERFLDKVNRTLFVYGDGGVAKILERENLTISHTEQLFRVRMGNTSVFMYARERDHTAWAPDRKLRECMKLIDEMFVLEDLSRL